MLRDSMKSGCQRHEIKKNVRNGDGRCQANGLAKADDEDESEKGQETESQ